jgi:hypothetical protein
MLEPHRAILCATVVGRPTAVPMDERALAAFSGSRWNTPKLGWTCALVLLRHPVPLSIRSTKSFPDEEVPPGVRLPSCDLALRVSLADYRQRHTNADNPALLEKSFAVGHMTPLEYEV